MIQIDLWKRVMIVLTVVLGLLLAFPNAFYSTVELSNDAEAEIATFEAFGQTADPEVQSAADAWPTWMPSGLVNLGLDLRGGAHLLAEVQLEQVYEARMRSFWPVVRDALVAERDTIGFVTREDSQPDVLRVKIGNVEGMPRALELVRALAQPIITLTGVGANDIEVRARGDELMITLSDAERLATDGRTMQQSLEIVRRRIDEAGTREPTIQRQGANRILIQVPGIGSAEEVKLLIGAPGQLGFHPVVGQASNPNEAAGIGNIILPDAEFSGQYWIVEELPILTGDDLADAQPAFDQNNLPAVSIRFNPSGGAIFGRWSSENIGELFAIVLDGEVQSAPQIREAITGGSANITGNFNLAETTNLAILLRAGALPTDLEFLEERTIGPELGQDSIDAGKVAALVGLIGVAVFMTLSYGWFGVMANVALGLNIVMIFGVLSLIGATLTLPGIAGIVLTVGMAVDANVLVFERIREELKTAKGPARAIELGYEKALSAIFDSNFTTFMTAVILYAVGSGPVRGFAITLGLGIMTSVFTAIFVTRLFIVIWFERRRPKTIEV